MSEAATDINPYELLGIQNESTEAEIRKAYRQQSLKVHPDRHPNNPDAARKFHELNQTYELLLDPIRRSTLDDSLRVQQARKIRFAAYDNKRRNLQEELEERERAFKKARTDGVKEKKAKEDDLERIKEEGRRLMKKKEQEAMEKLMKQERKEKEVMDKGKAKDTTDNGQPPLGPLDTTVRLKYSISAHPTLTTPGAISTYLASKGFGSIDTSSIVLSIKKKATALVPFTNVANAHEAVLASGKPSRGLEGIEVKWAGGSEPEIVKWLGKVGSTTAPSPSPTPATTTSTNGIDNTSFSSFPESFSFTPPPQPSATAPTSIPGLDYESLTLMRLRQAEREKLEREIRAQEEEGS